MSSLALGIQNAMKEAMRARDKARLGVIRLIQAAIKQKEVDERITLTDTDILAVLDKMLKSRRESISQFQEAGRDDLVSQENYEITVIQSFLPQPFTPQEVDALVTAAIGESGASSIKEMGKVMAILKPKLMGRADLANVSQKVKTLLNG